MATGPLWSVHGVAFDCRGHLVMSRDMFGGYNPSSVPGIEWAEPETSQRPGQRLRPRVISARGQRRGVSNLVHTWVSQAARSCPHTQCPLNPRAAQAPAGSSRLSSADRESCSRPRDSVPSSCRIPLCGDGSFIGPALCGRALRLFPASTETAL